MLDSRKMFISFKLRFYIGSLAGCRTYFIVMGTCSWKGLLWLSLPKGNNGIFWN